MQKEICFGTTRHRPVVDDFMRGYIEAALWTTRYCEQDGTSTSDYLSDRYGIEDLGLETLAQIARDCQAFRFKMKEQLELVTANGYEWSQAGHDFWMSRDEQGCGFFDHIDGQDKQLDGKWKQLHDAAKAFKRVDMEVDNDGRIQQIG